MFSLLLTLLSAITVIKAATFSEHEQVTGKGLLLSEIGTALLTGDKYIITVDLKVKLIDDVINNQSSHFNWYTPSNNASYNEAILQQESLRHITLTEKKTLQAEMLHLGRMAKRIKAYILSPQRRRRRQLYPGGGEVLKFLIGTPSQQDLFNVHKSIENLIRTDEEIIQIQEQMAIYLNRTDSLASRTAVELYHLAKLLDDLNTIQFFNTNSRRLYHNINKCENMLHKLQEAWTITMQNKLSPYFIDPETLFEILTKIQTNLPPGLTLLNTVTKQNVYMYYTIAKVSAAAFNNTIRIFCQIPLRSHNRIYTVYRTIPFPIFFKKSKLSAFINPPTEFFAISENLQQYFYLTLHDLLACTKDKILICPPVFAVRRDSDVSCLYALFRGFDKQAELRCDKRLTLDARATFYRSEGSDIWYYSVPQATIVLIKCPYDDTNTIRNSQITLTNQGKFRLNSKCEIQSEHFNLLPHITLTSHFNISLDKDLITPKITSLFTKTDNDLLTTASKSKDLERLIREFQLSTSANVPYNGAKAKQIIQQIQEAKKRVKISEETLKKARADYGFGIGEIIAYVFGFILFIIAAIIFYRFYNSACFCKK